MEVEVKGHRCAGCTRVLALSSSRCRCCLGDEISLVIVDSYSMLGVAATLSFRPKRLGGGCLALSSSRPPRQSRW